MTELYLRLLDKILTPVLLLLAVWLLLRGHNLPGGGFIAGLAGAAAIQLQILSLGDRVVRARLGPRLQPLTATGLLLAVGAAVLGLIQGGFFRSVWLTVPLGTLEIELSTPMMFDLGVFFVVVSVVASYLLALSRPREEEGL